MERRHVEKSELDLADLKPMIFGTQVEYQSPRSPVLCKVTRFNTTNFIEGKVACGAK
jgi:hypothetical protein